MTSSFKIGTTSGGRTALSALSTPVRDPTAFYYPSAKQEKVGDGTTKALGNPYTVWTWKSITRAERDKLRTFCTGTSAAIFITSPGNDSNLTFTDFSGIMTWPITEKYTARDTITDFSITFTRLVNA